MYCLAGACKAPSSRSSRSDDSGEGGYPVVQMAKPGEDGDDEGPRQFFVTNEDGSPGEEPDQGLDFDPDANQFEMNDEMRPW